jgi:phosphate transport system protein
VSGHIVSSFDKDINGIRSSVADMGHLAATMLSDAIDALVRYDVHLARSVIEGDLKLDALQHAIEERAVFLIALRQPMAIDLREMIAAIRIAGDIERMGDLAKNIAKRVLLLKEQQPLPHLVSRIQDLAVSAKAQILLTLEAYQEKDVQKAFTVCRQDVAIDDAYTSIFREFLTYMMEGSPKITFCIHLLFCAKNIERIGDHATNISETLYYLITGAILNIEQIPPPSSDTPPEALLA